MMKYYKVVGESALMDVAMDVVSAEQASELYSMMRDSGIYTNGYVMSNETGELFCHFSYEDGGITEWTAFP